MEIRYTISESLLKRLLVAETKKGICAVSAADSDRALERELKQRFPDAVLKRDDRGMRKSVAHVLDLIRGHASGDTLPLDLEGTQFQKSVWAELLRIPRGETRSYGEIAKRIKRPTAYRAVAQACGANPVAIIVPCHRVVSSDGSLGGYGGGLDRKRFLLKNEGHRNPRWS
jgi:AraC family transcriptional regulator, regulatory protein of adaptative response / methylated-DNA-[protein]-cysteine methyltransferase